MSPGATPTGRGAVGDHAPSPPIDLTLPGVLEAQAARQGSRPFIVLPGARLSFAEADEVANRAANALAGLGCREGSTVMTLCTNGLAQVAAWLGAPSWGQSSAPSTRFSPAPPSPASWPWPGARCWSATPSGWGRWRVSDASFPTCVM
ncbi:MAG: AMP-binding protein [Acidimicrobiales bacterium]